MLLNVESAEKHILYDPNYLKLNIYEVVFKKGRIWEIKISFFISL